MGNTTWDNLESSYEDQKNSVGRVRYFKIGYNESIIIRPVGAPCDFDKYIIQHDGEFRSAVCLDQSKCPVARKHNIRPQNRWAINIINRKTNFIEVFENSPLVFKEFAKFFNQTGKNPGGTDGAQWSVSIDGVGKSKKYILKCIGPHTLSKDDMELITKQELYKLQKIYKATNPNLIEEILLGEKKSATNSYSKQDLENIGKINNVNAEPITLDELLK